MRKWNVLLAAGLGVGLVVGGLVISAQAEKEEKVSIKAVMGKFHKGKPPICAKASKGEATETELKEMLAGYTAMCGLKPPKGDAEAWVKKCTALIDATKSLIEKKDGAAAAYQAAVNCKGCHDLFKG